MDCIYITIRELSSKKIVYCTPICPGEYDGPGCLWRLSESHERPQVINMPSKFREGRKIGWSFEIQIEDKNSKVLKRVRSFSGHILRVADGVLDEFIESNQI